MSLSMANYRRRRRTSPILELDNLLTYTDFTDEGRITFESDNKSVSSVDQTLGSLGFTNSEDTNLEFDASLFGGVGGVKLVDNNGDIRSDGVTGSPATTSFGLVLNVPTFVDSRSFLSFGSATIGNSSARLVHSTVGRLRWGRDAGSGFPIICDTGSDGLFFIIGRIDDLGNDPDPSMVITVYDLTGDVTDEEATFEPDVAYEQDYIWLGDRGADTDGVDDAGYAEYFQTTDYLTDEEVIKIMEYWQGKYKNVS